MKRADHAALAFFGVCVVLTLAVSIPATLDALTLFHGPSLAWLALIVFEVGAVGAKLATLAIPAWRGRLTALTLVLLAVTTGANYAHGYDLSQAAEASPTLGAVLADPFGAVVATLATAALFPALLFVFLSAFVARAEHLLSGRSVSRRVRAIVARSRARVRRIRSEVAPIRAELAEARATLAQYEAWLRQARAELERERSRPVLTVETAAELFVSMGAPESTVRGWRKRLEEAQP